MRRQYLLIIIGVLLLALAVVFVVLTPQNDEGDANTNTDVPAGSTVQNTNSDQSNTNTGRVLTEEEKQRGDVTRIAGIFAEQYGTYRGGFSESNLTALATIVTSTFAKQLESQAVTSSGSNEFETIVLSTTIATFAVNDESVVSVSTLRQETKEDGTASVVSQELALQMVYQNGSWLVASAQWKTPAAADTLQ